MSDKKVYLAPIKKELIKKKKKKRKSELLSFFVILFVLGAFFISPIPDYLFSLIPKSVIDKTISPFYQDVVLSEIPEKITEPRKYADIKPLPVLGHNTGICFTFNGTTNNVIKLAKKRKIIAEIIAISSDKVEYTLDDITLDQPKGSNISIICQKFSQKHSLIPDQIKAVYVRPIAPFTPSKITWATVKKLNN